MKKYSFILLGIFITQFSFGQIKSGEITYKVRPPQELKNYRDTTDMNPIIKDVVLKSFAKAKKTVPYLSYTLTFNTKEAFFKTPRFMNNDNGLNLTDATYQASAFGDYYTNTEKDLRLHQFRSINNKWLVQSKIEDLHWHISQETKTIKGYVCKKATTTVRFNFKVDGTITAWFCPELPFHYGPIGLSGLPGLILGVERRNYFIYADDINFSKKDRKIKKPTKGKSVTEDGYFKEEEKFMPSR